MLRLWHHAGWWLCVVGLLRVHRRWRRRVVKLRLRLRLWQGRRVDKDHRGPAYVSAIHFLKAQALVIQSYGKGKFELNSICQVKRKNFFWYLGQVGDVAGTDGVTAA